MKHPIKRAFALFLALLIALPSFAFAEDSEIVSPAVEPSTS